MLLIIFINLLLAIEYYCDGPSYFNQSSYNLVTDHVVLQSFNKKYFKSIEFKNTKLNRTIKTIDVKFDLIEPITKKWKIELQPYMFLSNEYRPFAPLRTILNVCDILERNAFGMQTFMREYNIGSKCPIPITVSVTVSVLTLTFISVDRWYAICFPLKFKSTTGRAKTAIAVIWLVALTFDIPELVVYTTKPNEMLAIETIFFTQCEPSWSLDTDTFWTVLKMFLLYVVPLAFMTGTYYQIIRVLWRSGNVSHHSLGVSSGRQGTFCMNTNTNIEIQLRSRIKAAKMLVAVVVMFAFCYFPVHLLSVLRLTMELKNTDTNRAFALISHWLCYANSAVNPVIYNFMSGKFRKEFRRAIDCCSAPTEASSAYDMSSFYYKNTVKETSLNRSKKNGSVVRRAQGGAGADVDFATQRRGTRTSVIKIDV